MLRNKLPRTSSTSQTNEHQRWAADALPIAILICLIGLTGCQQESDSPPVITNSVLTIVPAVDAVDGVYTRVETCDESNCGTPFPVTFTSRVLVVGDAPGSVQVHTATGTYTGSVVTDFAGEEATIRWSTTTREGSGQTIHNEAMVVNLATGMFSASSDWSYADDSTGDDDLNGDCSNTAVFCCMGTCTSSGNRVPLGGTTSLVEGSWEFDLSSCYTCALGLPNPLTVTITQSGSELTLNSLLGTWQGRIVVDGNQEQIFVYGKDLYMTGELGVAGVLNLSPANGSTEFFGELRFINDDGSVACDEECFSSGSQTTGAMFCIDLGNMAPVSFAGSTSGGTDDSTPGAGCAPGATPGVPDEFFTWTAPADGDYSIHTTGSSFDTVLSVLDGACLGLEIGCNDEDPNGASSSALTLPLDEGQTITVMVDGVTDTDQGDFQLIIEAAP